MTETANKNKNTVANLEAKANKLDKITDDGKKHKQGDVIKVEKLNAEPGATVTFDQVVAISDKELKRCVCVAVGGSRVAQGAAAPVQG